MSLLLIGLNHRTAPIEMREELAFSREGVSTALLLFRQQFPHAEGAIVSTCNRVDMIVASDQDRPNADDVVSFLAQARDLPVSSFRQHLYELRDEQAARHLYRVAGGLDSMVLGETQIVSQLKAAYAQTSEEGTTGRTLNHLFHHAFSVGKRIRTETEIGLRKVSVPSVAVDVAKSIFSDFADKRVLVVGAGEMAQLTCQYLADHNASDFTVCSRTLNNARTLADAFHGRAVPYDQLDGELAHADIIITATACPKPIIRLDRLREAHRLRHGQPMFLIDLAVPRNVEPEVGRLNGVFLYDVDALGRIVNENREHRMQQMQRCEAILDEEVAAFMQWQAQSLARPVIEQMYGDAAALRDLEVTRLFNACPDLTAEQREAIEQLADRLVNKFMYPCVRTLREHSTAPSTRDLAQALHAVVLKHTANGQPREDRAAG